MTERISTDIAIIGAGVIGMAIAERLLAEGRDVVVIDPNPPWFWRILWQCGHDCRLCGDACGVTRGAAQSAVIAV